MLQGRREAKKSYALFSSTFFFFFICFLSSSSAELTDKGVNFEGNVHQQNLPPLLSFSFFLPKTCFFLFLL